jgi:hypothetical protein
MRQNLMFLGCSNNYDLLKEDTKRIINWMFSSISTENEIH